MSADMVDLAFGLLSRTGAADRTAKEGVTGKHATGHRV